MSHVTCHISHSLHAPRNLSAAKPGNYMRVKRCKHLVVCHVIHCTTCDMYYASLHSTPPHLNRRRRRRPRKYRHAKLLPQQEGGEDKGEGTGPQQVQARKVPDV
jgi:hypothetical protein